MASAPVLGAGSGLACSMGSARDSSPTAAVPDTPGTDVPGAGSALAPDVGSARDSSPAAVVPEVSEADMSEAGVSEASAAEFPEAPVAGVPEAPEVDGPETSVPEAAGAESGPAVGVRPKLSCATPGLLATSHACLRKRYRPRTALMPARHPKIEKKRGRVIPRPTGSPGAMAVHGAREREEGPETLRTGPVSSAASAEFRCLLGSRTRPGSNPPPGWGAPTRRTDGPAPGCVDEVTLRHGRRIRRCQRRPTGQVPCWTAQQTTDSTSDVNRVPISRNIKFPQVGQVGRVVAKQVEAHWSGSPGPAEPVTAAARERPPAVAWRVSEQHTGRWALVATERR
ncbi:hypothetical protein SAMN05444920_120244 [Nonomuraea solani]|uniref:Uncharacterized protein n=1 Tax=Nonomuraea solani TaxID=1144553 RepID=A0A1H6EUI5_9ACTN|nr:hypothetical protein SAMN05444920_120244 [Nonomuraea solani]